MQPFQHAAVKELLKEAMLLNFCDMLRGNFAREMQVGNADNAPRMFIAKGTRRNL
jgi:hypothetical protein